jgi:hypothetical protein
MPRWENWRVFYAHTNSGISADGVDQFTPLESSNSKTAVRH